MRSSIGSSTASIPGLPERARRRRSPASPATTWSRSTTKHFVPNNAILAVVGDLSADEAFSTVQKVFGSWGA